MKRNRLCSSWAKVLGCVLLVVALAACRSTVRVPDAAQPTAQQASVFPDYRDVVIPPNIAPLNFQVNNPADEIVVQIKGQRGEPLVAEAETAGKLRFDSTEWRRLLTDNRGGQLSVVIFTQHEGQWLQHPAWKWTVAAEPIDSFLTYRLIEPSYELYRQLGLYERNLTNFDEHPIYENNDTFEEENNHCVNCHTPQAHGTTGRMLFHVRSKHGGTVFIEGKNIRRVDMKCDSVLGGSVYPAWHPRQPWVVFSSNKTGQAFRLNNAQKVEVVDYDSDLLFYDVQHNKLSNVFRTPAVMETFPAWAPDGSRLYYCAAPFPKFESMSDSARLSDDARQDAVLDAYREVRYNVMSVPFDARTRTFGAPRLEVDCRTMGKSGTLPRISPDGRYLLITLGDFGQFHIWHKSSDLWVKDLKTGAFYPLRAANSPEVDSYHTWSSNGRWIVFSSRRLDGNFTRPCIAYFDRNGQAHKAFLLPQEDPEHNWLRMKSYNVPELSRRPVPVSPEELRRAIYDDAAAGHAEFGK